MLTDRFGRTHDYLRISLTDKCNLRCSYCMPYDLPKGFYANAPKMSAVEIDSIVSVFVKLGIKKVRLTGGEPLIRRDFRDIIHLLSKYPVELVVTTNGIYLDEFIDDFKKNGIRSVNVSLDTLSKSKFFEITKRDYFDRIMKNIHLLLVNDFQVKVNIVLMKNINDNEILDFVAWTKDIPLHLRFIEFMPFNGNRWEKEKIVVQDEALEKIKECYKVIKLKDELQDTAKKYKISEHAGTFAFISTVSQPFCSGCNRIRLTSDGKLRNCLFSQSEIEILGPLRKGENIIPLIQNSVKRKELMLGGQRDFDAVVPGLESDTERAMVSIGG